MKLAVNAVLKVVLVQMNSIADKAANIAAARAAIAGAVDRERPDLIVLPETWDYVGGSLADRLAAAEPMPGGAAYSACATLAREHRVWIHAGSIRERVGDASKTGNTTVVFDRDGGEKARYRKVHLFDVTLPDGVEHNESAVVQPGRELVTYDLEGVTVGCAICYDLRFPQLFAALVDMGAQVIVLPSAFTLQTGRDHWEVLCRARAIETQSWLLAPGQWGPHTVNGELRTSFGRSLVVDPWGTVVAQAADGAGIVAAAIDVASATRVRQRMPVAAHRVPDGALARRPAAPTPHLPPAQR